MRVVRVGLKKKETPDGNGRAWTPAPLPASPLLLLCAFVFVCTRARVSFRRVYLRYLSAVCIVCRVHHDSVSRVRVQWSSVENEIPQNENPQNEIPQNEIPLSACCSDTCTMKRSM
jgi:hypothetical protein